MLGISAGSARSTEAAARPLSMASTNAIPVRIGILSVAALRQEYAEATEVTRVADRERIEAWIYELRNIRQTLLDTVEACEKAENRRNAVFFLAFTGEREFDEMDGGGKEKHRPVGIARLFPTGGSDREEVEKRLGRSLPDATLLLSMMVVDPAMRHRGVGTSLVHRVLEEVHSDQVVCVEVKAHGDATTEFWKRLGFVETGRYERYGSPIVWMERPGTMSIE